MPSGDGCSNDGGMAATLPRIWQVLVIYVAVTTFYALLAMEYLHMYYDDLDVEFSDTFDTQLAAPEGENAYYAPLRQFPEGFTEAQKDHARAALTAAIEGTLYPAMRRLRAYLSETYLPQARDTIGATEAPGGDAYYAYRIEEMTTLSSLPKAASKHSDCIAR